MPKSMTGFIVLLMVAGVGYSVYRWSTNNPGDPTTWPENLKTAAARAKAENKLVMLDFTGSDWCGYCVELKKNVFTSPEFSAWARDRIVFLEVDFPMRSKLPAELAEQNAVLKRLFSPEGFPTILVVTPEGKVVAKTVGYDGAYAKNWIAMMQGQIDKNLK